jgi:hemerythrin-like domain-containing protein
VTAPKSPTAPICRHHRHLTGLLDQLLALVAAAEPDARPAGPELVRTMAALERALRSHAEAEDCFLYPEVARLMSDPRTATTMNADHAAVRERLRNLCAEVEAAAEPKGGLTAERLELVSRAAGGLAGLLRAHFEKEERVFLPVVEARMTADEIRKRIIDPMNAMSGTGPAPRVRRSVRKT